MAIREQMTCDLIDFLNDLVAMDAKCIEQLITHKVDCNEELAQHPTVQVGSNNEMTSSRCGILGILNGFCGTYDEGPKEGWGPIAAVFDDAGSLMKFELTHPL